VATESPDVPETADGAEPAPSFAAAEPVVPASRRPADSPNVGVEGTAIVLQRPPRPVKESARAKPAVARTYVSAYSHKEAEADHHEPEPAGKNGDGTAAASDVRVVLQPKRLGRDNGGKAS
jgi:hypothetical protein